MVVELLLLGALAALPNLEPERMCRNARSLALPEDQGRAYQGCLLDERQARATLKLKWESIPPEARAMCVGAVEMSLSYVEILTCIDLHPGGDLGGAMPNYQPRGR